MARDRLWRNRLFTQPVGSTGFSMDLIQAAGVTPPGSTMQRSIGRFDVEGVRGVGGSAIQIRWGVLVTTTPDPQLIASSNNYKFTAYGAGSLEVPGLLGGHWLSTTSADERFEWDSEGQRTFTEGQSVWLMVTLMGFLSNPAPVVTGYSRTLILGVDE